MPDCSQEMGGNVAIVAKKYFVELTQAFYLTGFYHGFSSDSWHGVELKLHCLPHYFTN